MSYYVNYYNEKQEAYKSLGTQYLNYMDNNKLEPEELQAVSNFLSSVATRFGLRKDFTERGII